MNQEPGRFLDRLVGACFSLLLGALALYIAAKLVAAVWTILLLACLVVGVLLGLAVLVHRSRSNGW